MTDKLNDILDYLKEHTKVKIPKAFAPVFVKTDEQFLKLYSMHDKATEFIALKYFQANYSLHPIGKDLRNQQIYIRNEIPDYFTEKIVDTELKDYIFFCFDVKAKSKVDYFGWVNEKSINDYRKFSRICGIPVYLIFSLIKNKNPTDTIGFCDISQNPIRRKTSWDKYEVLIFEWYKGMPFLNE